MQMLVHTPLPLPSEDDATESLNKISALTTVQIEPVGRWYEAYCFRRFNKQTLSHHSLQSSSSESSDGELSADDEDDEALLMTLDPKEWKNQDHYAVLGIQKLRCKATDDQIKRAYKKKVLKHHPDKRRARGIPVKEGEEDYFTCITRSYEILGNPTKRRSFDSVDPEFDNSVPTASDIKPDFFNVLQPVFERNSRWSIEQPVPLLGNDDTSFEDVDHFYAFWYDMNIWREFSYLDEEEKEKGENRDERRWILKQNKAERQKRKKEEITRIRNLVDLAYSLDPRILRHKENKKLKKQQEKEEKREAIRKKKEEEERVRREAEEKERLEREKIEEEARQKAAVIKKEKEAQKKILKKERKTFRTKLKDYEYFAGDDKERVHHMAETDKLAELLSVLELQSINEDLTSGDAEKAKTAFITSMTELNDKIEKEKQEQLEKSRKQQSSSSGEGKGSKGAWADEEVQMLIKAVNLFPAGTVQRWETVASFISQHVPGSNRSAKEVLAKAKSLQKMDTNLKQAANDKAFDQFSKGSKSAASTDNNEASQRYISAAEAVLVETGSNPAPWTAEEQKLLEQGLKTFGASVSDRWDKIADSIPTRSKKDCMKRYKELAETIKAKKLAQLEAQKKMAAKKQ